jgi:phage tail-like protein
MASNLPTSSYLQYLPATFQSQKLDSTGASPALSPDPFVGRFLLAFERLMSGLDNIPDPEIPRPIPPGIEQTLTGIPKYFVPHDPGDPSHQVPADFLPWLASWVSVSLRGDWTEAQQRAFIAKIPSLYRKRGTKACMQEMLDTIVPGGVQIEESTTVPHYFTVTFILPDQASSNLYQRAVRAIIDEQKPAYTFYGLNMIIPTPMTIPVIIGVTTIVGAAPRT